MQEDRLQFMRCFMRSSDGYFTRPLQNTQPQSTNDYQVKHFAHMLGAFDLKQYVNGISHNDGHTLDLVITRSEDSIVRKIWIRDPAISDH